MFIDIHVHTRRIPVFPRGDKPAYTSTKDLIQRFDDLGIEKAVILPGVSPECSRGVQAVEDVVALAEENSPRLIPFCNVDPRALKNSPDAPLDDLLEYYKEMGCKGVGELTANLAFTDPMVQNLFRCCEKTQMPVTFHISPTLGGNYGLFDEPGLPLLEESLKNFPGLVFLGHSQAFWAEIGVLENADDRGGYPKGPVASPGRVVELMRAHPNLHGDLSANSGCNAVSRDEAFGLKFMDEFQDRLHFGTDICAPGTPTPLVDYLLKLRRENKLSEEIFQKIAHLNTERLLEV